MQDVKYLYSNRRTIEAGGQTHVFDQATAHTVTMTNEAAQELLNGPHADEFEIVPVAAAQPSLKGRKASDTEQPGVEPAKEQNNA